MTHTTVTEVETWTIPTQNGGDLSLTIYSDRTAEVYTEGVDPETGRIVTTTTALSAEALDTLQRALVAGTF